MIYCTPQLPCLGLALPSQPWTRPVTRMHPRVPILGYMCPHCRYTVPSFKDIPAYYRSIDGTILCTVSLGSTATFSTSSYALVCKVAFRVNLPRTQSVELAKYVTLVAPLTTFTRIPSGWFTNSPCARLTKCNLYFVVPKTMCF